MNSIGREGFLEIQQIVVRTLAEKLRNKYIFPDVAGKIATLLEERLSSGKYTRMADGQDLASMLTHDIQEINHDIHLVVDWTSEPLPEEEDSLFQSQEWLEEQRISAQFHNNGLYKIERLAGNVGYLDIREFHNLAWGAETAISAMTFLSSTHALIFDLRNCSGGDPDMVALISSYLFDETPIHLNSMYGRDEEERHYWTLSYVPGKRSQNKLVYVLTSKYTFSGGEEFAYNLKSRNRAVIVGETSGGGAHPGMFFRLHQNFQAFIPTGRAYNPITKSNWEGSGVAPDIETPADDALRQAHRLALMSLIQSNGSTDQLLLQEAQQALLDLK
jgi:retinol-binding protein 3